MQKEKLLLKLQQLLQGIRSRLAPVSAWCAKNLPRARDWMVTKFQQSKLSKSPWVKKLEPTRIAGWANTTFHRPGMGFYGKLLTLALCSYFLADLTALIMGRWIPEPPPSRMIRSGGFAKKNKSIEDYGVIFSRNLFNSQGRIPGEEPPTSGTFIDQGGAPVKTTLPFNLIGTVILKDELRSLATIEDKTAAAVYPVRVEDEIPAKAKIIRVEARKVIFLNKTNGRKEFVDMPEDLQTTAPRIALGGVLKSGGGAGVEKLSSTQFNVQGGEVDKALGDFNNVLTQARAVPNFENGVPAGYKLFQIVPGSIYDKLGLQNGDVISGLNGQTINDPGKAFEMLGELKTAKHLELQVKRDGKASTFTYDINR